MTADSQDWKVRVSRTYGSKHLATFKTLREALAFVGSEIDATGGEGQIKNIIHRTRTVYFSRQDDSE